MSTGSLPDKDFGRLADHVGQDGMSMLNCSACEGAPDDPKLIGCGHIYCSECSEGNAQCVVSDCQKRLRRETELEPAVFKAIRTMFKVKQKQDQRAARDIHINNGSFRRDTGPAAPARTQHFQSRGGNNVMSDSDDDGFDNRSQRSVSYGDGGNSFVADDASSVGGEQGDMEDSEDGSDDDLEMDVSLEELRMELEDLQYNWQADIEE